jgi:hypothetical protein
MILGTRVHSDHLLPSAPVPRVGPVIKGRVAPKNHPPVMTVTTTTTTTTTTTNSQTPALHQKNNARVPMNIFLGLKVAVIRVMMGPNLVQTSCP